MFREKMAKLKGVSNMLSEKCLSKKKYIFEKLATSLIMHKH